MKENEISFYVRKAIFSVYNELGPGLFEKVYEKVLMYELKSYCLKVKSQVPISVQFKDMFIDSSFLKLTGLKLGILVNFNTDYIDKSIFRKLNGNLD
ncbi:GxxExxY protein [Chryseobacterium sp. GP-SGM7]|uniref:GxxExxY protein n=1 Tax=Chryseobacterium sp. GP-SGM7 TaxID=3411323 RepID=UPI003B93D1AB